MTAGLSLVAFKGLKNLLEQDLVQNVINPPKTI